jgi:Holliday junction resolvase RusA-like endonuclease
MTMAFRLNCVPPTANHQRKRIVKIGKFSRLADKPELVAAKAMLDELLLPHQPPAPVPGPYVMTLEFTWPWRASESKRVRALGRIPHTSRPDCSNLTKTIEDRLVALRFMDDDNAVVDLRVRKFWGDDPGIVVAIATLTDREDGSQCSTPRT